MTSPGAIIAAARRAPRWTVASAGLSATVFVILTLLVSLGATRTSDLAWTLAFQSLASYPLDVIANAHTVVGQAAVTLPLAVVLAAVSRRRFGGYVWLGPLLILATGAVEVVLKIVTAHPAPPRELVRAFGNPLGIPRDLQPAFAFPSGHVARIAFLAVLIGGLTMRTAVAIVAAAFVAASVFLRVYIGDHWISDALGGLALGTTIGMVAVAWMRATARR